MIIKTIKTKKDNEVIFRYPCLEDLNALTEYINTLSKEDTYIRFSGEIITKEDEKKYLTNVIKNIEKGDGIVIQCWIENRLIGICNIDRNFESRKRELHTGIFGISVNKNYRGEGIGYELAKITIEEAKKKIKGLRMVILDVYEPNTAARSLYKKLSFIEAGMIPQACFYRGQYVGKETMYLNL